MTDNFDFFDLDQDALDREWVQQPKLYFTHAVKLADAERDLGELKAELNLRRAEVDKAVRASPENYGIEKMRESSVEACIVVDQEYRAIATKINNKEHDANVLKAAIQALNHRKTALENLVDLRLANYFSEPRARNDKRMDDVKVTAGARRANEAIKRKRDQRA